MEKDRVNPEIDWKHLNGKTFLNFTFKGTLTHQDAVGAIAVWKNLFREKEGKQSIIWNCREMKGYEPMARALWQNTIKELKGQIDSIWLISDSATILAGAKIISLFASFNIKPVKSEEDIKSD